MFSIHVSHSLKMARFAIGGIGPEPALGKAHCDVGHLLAATFGFKF